MSDDERQKLDVFFWLVVALLAAGSAFVYLWLSWAGWMDLNGWTMAALIFVAFIGQSQIWPGGGRDQAE